MGVAIIFYAFKFFNVFEKKKKGMDYDSSLLSFFFFKLFN